MGLIEFKRRIETLKASHPLHVVIGNDGHKLVLSGGMYKLCCPFHREKTPSCVIYPDGHFHCFGCFSRGDVFSYVMQRDGCSFKEAVEKLDGGKFTPTDKVQYPALKAVKKEPELPRDYFSNLMCDYEREETAGAVIDLSHKLGVPYAHLTAMNVIWHRNYRVYAFPMKDFNGNTIGIRLRDKNGKKWAVKGSKQGLFIPYMKVESDLYVTEGPTDCAAMLSMGLYAIGKAAAMQGPEEIVKFIKKHSIRRVIVIADNDDAGLRGATKLIDVCPVPCCELVLPAKDAREFYRNGGTRELVENLIKSAVWRRPKHA